MVKKITYHSLVDVPNVHCSQVFLVSHVLDFAWLTLFQLQLIILLFQFIISRQSMYQLWKLRQEVFDAEVVR